MVDAGQWRRNQRSLGRSAFGGIGRGTFCSNGSDFQHLSLKIAAFQFMEQPRKVDIQECMNGCVLGRKARYDGGTIGAVVNKDPLTWLMENGSEFPSTQKP